MNPLAKQSNVKDSLRRVLTDRRRGLCGPMLRVEVDRHSILQTGAQAIMRNIKKLKHSMLVVSFKDEMGEDYGAIRREFFYLAMQQFLQDPRLCSTNSIYDVIENSECPEFLYSDDTGIADIIEDVLCESIDAVLDDSVFFIFLGLLVGLFLHYNETLHANFSLAFYENLLWRKFTPRHFQDPIFQRSILRCMREKIEGYDAGAIERIVLDKLFTHKKNAYDFIRLGFRAVVTQNLAEFTAFDFPFVFHHYEPISVGVLLKYVNYSNCSNHTQETRWLWEILAGKDQAYLCRFLQFFTGSGSLECFDENTRFWFEKTKTRLFKASSCAKRLFFGSYESREEMEHYLDYSILNTEGFHKV